MRKYLILTSLLALTGCMLGDGGSANGLLLLFDNDDVYSKSMFAATPEYAKKSNSNLTNMESVFDFSDRIVEIWNKSGIDLNIPESELPELDVDGAVAQNLYDQMSDEKKLILRKAKYIQNLMNSSSSINDQEWRDIAAWINAVYDVESKGKVTQVLDPDTVPTTPAQIQLLLGEVWWRGDNAIIYNSKDVYVDTDTGKFANLWGNNRIGDTNRFVAGNWTYTYDSFGGSSYMDYGIVTGVRSDGESWQTSVYMGLYDRVEWLKWVDKRTPETWKFAGGAVGLYYHDTTDDPDQASHTFTMQTDNATLEISGDRYTGINTVLNMPFSNWYDVKATGSGGSISQLEFTNYTGDNEHRINDSSSIVHEADGSVYAGGDYKFDPSEAGGWINSCLNCDGTEHFHATFGMTRQE